METPPVPACVTELAAAGALPPEFAAVFTPAGEPAEGTDWSDVADVVDRYLAADAGADAALRGVLALAGAYGRLDRLDRDAGEPALMAADNDRAVELLEEAEANGVDAEQTRELWWYSDRIAGLAAELIDENDAMDAYLARHGTTPSGRLEAELTRADELYAAGDRAAALALFREVAAVDPWESEFGGCLDRIDVAWCRLLHDAAHVDGPDAARRIWREARAHHRAATFPLADHAWQLVGMLLGTGVADIIEAVIRAWVAAAEENGTSEVPVDEEAHRLFRLALAEIEAAGPAEPPSETARQDVGWGLPIWNGPLP